MTEYVPPRATIEISELQAALNQSGGAGGRAEPHGRGVVWCSRRCVNLQSATCVSCRMNTLPDPSCGTSCELDFSIYGSCTEPTHKVQLPNIGDMGVVELDSAGTFVRRRPLNNYELAAAWSEHHRQHAGQPMLTAAQQPCGAA